MALGCAVWGFRNYFSADGRALDLVFGIGSVVISIGLVLYERYFLKKSKNISYI